MAINKNKVLSNAQKFAEKGAYDKAIGEYLKVVKEDPEDVRAWLKIGDLYAKKGARKEATNTYLKVAEFYASQGFYLKSVAVYKQILKLDPTVIQVNLRLAELYQQLGLLSDAQSQYEHVSAYYQRSGQVREALDVMQKLVDLDPENVPSRIKLAELYSKAELRDDAVREFSEAGERLREQGRIDDYVKVAERLLWHKPDEIPLSRELASIYLERGDTKRALAKLQQCFQSDPTDVETLALLASAFQTIGQIPKTISVYREMSRLFGERGEEHRRREVLEAILALAPDDAEAHMALYGSPLGAQQAPAPQPAPAPGYDDFQQPAEPGYANQGQYEDPSFSPYQDPNAGFAQDPNQPYQDPNAVAYQDPNQPYQDPNAVAYQDPNQPYGNDPAYQMPDYGQEQGGAIAGTYDDVEEIEEFEEIEEVEEVVEYEEVADVEVVEDQNTDEEVQRLLTETDVFVKYGLFDKAIEHLQKVFEVEPLHVVARERLKELYIQLGDYDNAVAQLLYLSDLYVESDRDGALYYLQQITELIPDQPDAIERMRNLGVSVPSPTFSEPSEGVYAEASDLLVSVDEELAASYPDETDDVEPPPLELSPPTDEQTFENDPAQDAPQLNEQAQAALEEELEEVEFFVAQGLDDEALNMLTELAETFPGNPLVMAKLQEINGGGSESGAGELHDQSFDLGSQIPDELNEAQAGEDRSDGQVKDVFEVFKEGVAQQVDVGDADTHYDLGVAYKEMGLVEDAVAEFELARENPAREAIAQTMIGHCYSQNSQHTEAINAYKRGLYAEHKTDEEELELYYSIGTSYVAISDPKEALYYFQKVVKKKPDFRDVQQRIATLQSGGTTTDGSGNAGSMTA